MNISHYTRRDFLKTVGLWTTGLFVSGFAKQKKPSAFQSQEKKTNILLIMADDMGYSDIGCFGSEIHTPNLNRLSANGLRFTQFYNTARCCPTRASLLTGLYPHQTGIGHMANNQSIGSYLGDLNSKCVTIAEVLSGAGYSTYMSGKWHLTKQLGRWTGDPKSTSKHSWPLQRGFESFYGTIAGTGSYFDPVTLTRDNTPIEPETDNYYYTDAISDNAVRFITEHEKTKKDVPFFCYVAYTAPHWPIHALPEDIARYKGRYDEGWDVLRDERYKKMIELGIINPKYKLSPRDLEVLSWQDAKYKHWHRAAMEVYAAMIDRMDQGIGRIVTALEKTSQLENTLIIFLSDNGGCAEYGQFFETDGKSTGLGRSKKKTRDGKVVRFGHYATIMPGPADTYQEYGRPWANASNTPFRLFKRWVHEGGIATPFIAHWPGVIKQKGHLTDQLAHIIDIMPTCCDIAGAAYPISYKQNQIIPMQGKSILPIFQGEKIKSHEALYWEHEGNCAVRKGKFKLVSKYQGKWELYDIETDRTELNDLADKHPELVKELSGMYDVWAKRSNVVGWEQVQEKAKQLKGKGI